MTSGVIRTRKTPFLPANAYRKICGNFRNMSSLTRLISCGSITGAALPDGEPTDVLPIKVSRRNRQRDLVVACYVPHLLGFGCTPEINDEAIGHIIDHGRLRIPIRADLRDGHFAGGFEDREDLLPQTRVHFHPRNERRNVTYLLLSRGNRR